MTSFYVSNLPVLVPAALATLHSFGQISGYKLSLNKSEIFPINPAAKMYPLKNFPFKVAHYSFVYLGVHVTHKFEDLYKANFAPLLTRIQKDFERWSLLNLSLIARVNSVKMNILPRLSYLFQCIPLFLPLSFFCKLDSLISEFIWNKKVPRLRKQYLQRPKPLGGLALPNLRFYYWATNIRIFKYWLQYEPFDPPPAWLVFEASSAKPVSLKALVHSPIHSSTFSYTKNVIVKTSLRVWVQFKRFFGLQTFSVYAPLAANHAFPPSLINSVFLRWTNLGIHNFKDLYVNDVFATFQQLSDEFSLPKQHFFRYLQVRSFVHDTFPGFPNLPSDSALDSFLTPIPTLKGFISYIYSQISLLRSEPLVSIKSLWEEDLGLALSEEVWTEILRRVHKSSICARHSLIQCKILHRTYYTKARLAKIYDGMTPTCDRCGQSPANLINTLWYCPSLYNYWTEIFNTLSEVVGEKLKPNALSALFGVAPPSLSKSKKDVLAFATLLARRLIVINWKSATAPCHTHWIRDTLYFLKLEKIRLSLTNSSGNFVKLWGPFLQFVKRTDLSLAPD